MKKISLSLIAMLFITIPLTGHAKNKKPYLTECNLIEGDNIAKVKKFYDINFEPIDNHKLQKSKGPDYTYRFREYGVWVFFDDNKKLKTLRFQAPFSGKISGIGVGDTKAALIALKGEPSSELEGQPDLNYFQNRAKREQEILDDLPDPASKKLVREAFKKISELRSVPADRNQALIYKLKNSKYVRYEIESATNKVQLIFSDHC